MELGYTFMVSSGQGGSWKEILSEPVKWYNSTETVVDLGKVDLGKADLGDIVDTFDITEVAEHGMHHVLV